MGLASSSRRRASPGLWRSSRASAAQPRTTAVREWRRPWERGCWTLSAATSHGGAGAGRVALLDADLVPGAPLVVEAAGLNARLSRADLVITGEGRVDDQTAYGKAPGEVAKRASQAGVPVLLLAGGKGPGWE